MNYYNLGLVGPGKSMPFNSLPKKWYYQQRVHRTKKIRPPLLLPSIVINIDQIIASNNHLTKSRKIMYKKL